MTGGAHRVTTALGSPRRVATALGILAAILLVLSVVVLFWITGQTDNGMMCQPPFTPEDEPGACAIYAAPFWVFAAAVVAAVGAGVALVVALARSGRASG